MPDFCQDDQTCLPTSTANLIVWFGNHGYPKLIQPGATKDEQYAHTVHLMMRDTDARFDSGTRMDAITTGVKKYIEDAGYSCDVEFRGLGKTAFTQDWLKENDDPNKGFILLLAYISYDPNSNTYTNAWNAGHAVTLVNYTSDIFLIHDPAHEEDETGRKLLTAEALTSGTFVTREESAPVSGLLLLSGSLLEAPPGAGVMLTGAVCITLHPAAKPGDTPAPAPAGGPDSNVAGTTPPDSSPSGTTTAKPQQANTSWVAWLFNWFFSK